MDYQEIKTKSESELQRLLAEERNRGRELRFKDSNSQLKNVRQIRTAKKNSARILTALKVLKQQAK